MTPIIIAILSFRTEGAANPVKGWYSNAAMAKGSSTL
jgi:hypothetical protein